MFFVFDGGSGLGHLRRLARIAHRLQGRFSCLVVTGHRAAADWFVPAECEYVHLPSWDSLLPEKSRYWGRRPFLDASLAEAVRLRRHILAGVMRGFRPDALFVDHLPLGAHDELAGIVERADCRKYFVTRGVLNETEDLRRLILGGAAHAALRDRYNRILVAADPRVVDFARSYHLDPELRAKTTSTGYIVEPASPATIAAVRAERGLTPDDRWVVASAGGGQHGEATIRACIAMASAHPGLAFDIVAGPRSSLSHDIGSGDPRFAGRVRIYPELPDMAVRHASADVVICSGGYNSLLEALQGRAAILCVPSRRDPRDEPTRHAERLSHFAHIDVAPTAADLPGLFAATLERLPQRPHDRRAELDMGGAAAIERLVTDDLCPAPLYPARSR